MKIIISEQQYKKIILSEQELEKIIYEDTRPCEIYVNSETDSQYQDYLKKERGFLDFCDFVNENDDGKWTPEQLDEHLRNIFSKNPLFKNFSAEKMKYLGNNNQDHYENVTYYEPEIVKKKVFDTKTNKFVTKTIPTGKQKLKIKRIKIPGEPVTVVTEILDYYKNNFDMEPFGADDIGVAPYKFKGKKIGGKNNDTIIPYYVRPNRVCIRKKEKKDVNQLDKGTISVFGPANSLIGFLKGRNFIPAYGDYLKGIIKQDKEILNNKDELKNYLKTKYGEYVILGN